MVRFRRNSRSEANEASRALWRLSGMGVELMSHIAAGGLLGWLVDHWRGSFPTWVAVGTIAGLVVGMTEMIRTAMKAQKRATEQMSPRKSGPREVETGSSVGTKGETAYKPGDGKPADAIPDDDDERER